MMDILDLVYDKLQGGQTRFLRESVNPVVMVGLSYRTQLHEALARIAALEAAAAWVPVGERLPEVNEVGWSEDVQLAYKVIDGTYCGHQRVSRYYLNFKSNKMDWEYDYGKTLDDYGYEAVAWRPLPEPPEKGE